MSRPTGKLFGWALALLVIAAFTSLGAWQLGRAQQKEAMLAASQQVLAERKALPLSAAIDPERTAAYDWAAGNGHFLDVPAVLLDNQTRDSRPGIRAYRVFMPEAGAAPLLVDKGQSKRTVNALTWRIGLSVLLFALVALGIFTGVIKPHGVGG